MPTFEQFVQTELPLRPFVGTDGVAGQVLMRSTNPLAVRELVWGEMPGAVTPATYTSSNNLSGHRMVILNDSREIAYADNQTLVHANRVFGLTKGAVSLGGQVEVARNEEIQEPSWTWAVGGAIYLGSNGTLIQSAPVSPALFSLIVGWATASDRMFVSVGMPIILA